MKKLIGMTIAGITCIATMTSVFAADYTVAAPSAGIFGEPTSAAVVIGEHVNQAEIDKSKNSALIPPTFGSPTSNLPGSGEPLTPNLASPYLDSVTGQHIVGTPSVSVSSSVPPGNIPNVSTSQGNDLYIPGVVDTPNDYYYEYDSFTEVSDSMYYSGGYLATLKIPTLNLSVKVYEGTTNSVLAKGAGHFKDTSIWNGNVCIAAHNRGTNAYFGQIHTLKYGDKITLTTKLGTRTYRVFNVEKISVNDTSNLQGTYDNIITLITCVANQADYYRWCVQAEAID